MPAIHNTSRPTPRALAVTGLLFLFLAVAAVDGFASSITGQTALYLLQDGGTCTNGIVYTGVFAGGCDVNLSGYGIFAVAPGQTVTGGVTFTNAANGRASTASASGAIGGSLPGAGSTVKLRSGASIEADNAAPGLYRSDSNAIFSTQLDVSDLTVGTPYIYTFDFDLTGNTSATGGGRSFVDVVADIGGSAWCPGGCDALWQGRFTDDATISTDPSGNPNYFYVRPSQNVTSTSLTFQLRSFADDAGPGFTVGGTTAADSDFMDTLTLTGASIQNFNGTPVVGGRVVDTDGFVYSDVGTNVVPEPSSLVLFGLGLVGVAVKIRGARQPTSTIADGDTRHS